MAKISKMTIAKKNKSRIHVYLSRGSDEEYGFTVSEDVFIKHQLKKGMELTEEEIQAIREDDMLDKAFQKTLNYLSYRMRSEKEIYDYLKEENVSHEEALDMIDRLEDLNLIDDLQFAQAFVRTKKNTQRKGPRLIEQELYEKGISQKMINQALLEYPEEEELEIAIEVCVKKKKSYKNVAQRLRKQKLYQFLLQRGFRSGVANVAIDHCEQEIDEDVEWTALVKQGQKVEARYQKYEDWEQKQKLKQYLYQKGFSIDLIERWLEERSKID